MTNTRVRIPAHLRQYVVHQDYGAYDEIDQAVWRFVLLQTHARLQQTAHPAYREGLRQTGISVEQIPRIEEMDACLARYGWGAVCVDGFIPPRAFQEFQALGIMTIAAAIRTSEHLSYTPAPDIIHESAGHAPIIPDPLYRRFLQRIGEVGARAFSSLEDARVHAAIHRLSEVKEDPHATAAAIARAEREVEAAQRAVSGPSEAALVARLHWWTVEYGLVGSPRDYRLYGAGLLSSLGESHFCHDPAVRKLPLSPACVEVGYDITRPQPQLFVAESFEQAGEVLEAVAGGLAQRRGGALALARALQSQEVATLELDSGIQVSGRLAAVHEGPKAAVYLQLAGPCSLAMEGRQLPGHGRDQHPEGFGLPIGRLASGEALSQLDAAALRGFETHPGGPIELRYTSGVRVRGRVQGTLAGARGGLVLVSLADCHVSRGDTPLFRPEWGRYDLAIGETVAAGWAGPADPCYWPETDFSERRIPARKRRRPREALLIELCREALALWAEPKAAAVLPGFMRIAGELEKRFPEEWLLRWNLLECLCKLERGEEPFARELREQLLEIEARHPREAPISMGLRFLGQLPA